MEFQKGVKKFKDGNYESALASFTAVSVQCPMRRDGISDDAYTQAIKAGANVHSVYDSRAATYEKLGKLKDALKDSGQVIKVAPALVQVSDNLVPSEQQAYVIL